MQPQNQHEFRAIEAEVRHIDPLESVQPGYDDAPLVQLAERDIERIDGILEHDGTLTNHEYRELYDMGTNLRLDWLYAKRGGQQAESAPFLAKAKETEGFIERGLRQAEQYGKPQDTWALTIKQFDLRTTVAHRFAHDVQTVQRGNPNADKIWDTADRMNQRILHDSVQLMRQMEAVSTGEGTLAQDARGMLYELMLLTYARWQVYERQDFDTSLVRSALSREDRPWNQHVLPKRAFDMVIADAASTQLLQLKNHHNDDVYAAPIQKVEDEHFHDTLENLPTYLKDFQLLVQNQASPHLRERYNEAANRLDAVFGAQLAASR